MERLLRLMKLLSGNVNYSVGELADKLEMSPRTVYRYIDTFKMAGFAVTKLYGDTFKLGTMPKDAVDIDRLIYFSEEEAYLVNSLIDQLTPTNSLKANLKDKLSAIYSQTSIADYVDSRSNAAHVEALGQAVAERRQVWLRGYESGSSHTVRDRHVEPFGFTTDYIDVWAYDLEDGHNKVFKISRIQDVDITEEPWTNETEHHKDPSDIFRMHGSTPIHVRLKLSLMAKNLLVEEYPMAARDLKRVTATKASKSAQAGEEWILDTEVYQMAGVLRFVAGLMGEIEVLEGDEIKAALIEYGSQFQGTSK